MAALELGARLTLSIVSRRPLTCSAPDGGLHGEAFELVEQLVEVDEAAVENERERLLAEVVFCAAAVAAALELELELAVPLVPAVIEENPTSRLCVALSSVYISPGVSAEAGTACPRLTSEAYALEYWPARSWRCRLPIRRSPAAGAPLRLRRSPSRLVGARARPS